MRENFNNHRPRAPFDEGRNLDTGKIDPSTGERDFDDTDKFINAKERKERLDKERIENERLKRGVCKYCGQESFNMDCNHH